MSGQGNDHEEDHTVCMKVGLFFIAAIVMIVCIGMLK